IGKHLGESRREDTMIQPSRLISVGAAICLLSAFVAPLHAQTTRTRTPRTPVAPKAATPRPVAPKPKPPAPAPRPAAPKPAAEAPPKAADPAAPVPGEKEAPKPDTNTSPEDVGAKLETDPAVLTALEMPRKKPADFLQAVLWLIDLDRQKMAKPILAE